jgi:hypothetical protein
MFAGVLGQERPRIVAADAAVERSVRLAAAIGRLVHHFVVALRQVLGQQDVEVVLYCTLPFASFGASAKSTMHGISWDRAGSLRRSRFRRSCRYCPIARERVAAKASRSGHFDLGDARIRDGRRDNDTGRERASDAQVQLLLLPNSGVRANGAPLFPSIMVPLLIKVAGVALRRVPAMRV